MTCIKVVVKEYKGKKLEFPQSASLFHTNLIGDCSSYSVGRPCASGGEVSQQELYKLLAHVYLFNIRPYKAMPDYRNKFVFSHAAYRWNEGGSSISLLYKAMKAIAPAKDRDEFVNKTLGWTGCPFEIRMLSVPKGTVHLQEQIDVDDFKAEWYSVDATGHESDAKKVLSKAATIQAMEDW